MANIKQMYEDNSKTTEAYPRVWMPVGSLYWNENDISDEISKYFVGTWQRIKDVFILAAGDTYTAKTSGGEATHILTIDEMPAHNHRLGLSEGGINTGWGLNYTANSPYYRYYGGTDFNENTGKSQSHNNMPLYYVAYCWKRIS